MKGLAIKGKLFVGSVDYRVLWSEIVKDFNKLPFGTQLEMIKMLVTASGGSEDMDEGDCYLFVQSMETIKAHFTNSTEIIMKLADFIGKTVEVEGVSTPVVLKSVNGDAAYVNDAGQTISLGRLSDSVGRQGSAVNVKLSRIQG